MEGFNKTNLRSLRPELEKALADVCAKHGITATIGSGSFTESECKFRLILNLEGSEAKTKVDSATFERYATLYGLEPTDLGKSFMVSGNWYKVTGISPSRPKFPIDGERLDGRKFKFPALTVRTALGKNRATTTM